MTMYAHLLETALEEALRADGELNHVDVVAELIRRRAKLAEPPSSPSDSGWAPAAISDQLAYDIALITLARSIGLVCDLRRFDQPEEARRGLESAVRSRHIDLGGPT
jgi:hypothetical protein